MKTVIMKKQYSSKFSCGVEVGPIDSGSTIAGIEDKRLEGWVERS